MGIRSKPVKIIHDCDPGHDDAVAILMAAVHPAIDLQAVTVVAGNQTLEKTVRNALNICSASGRFSDIPVAAGMSRPMVREQVVAGDIHGESGLDGPVFDEPDVGLDPRHAVDLIIDLLLDSDDPITIVPTGPLTNIGMAIRKEPDIVEKIERIVLMGGAYQHGNVTPSAEFNIYADPEAAHVVFTCGRPIVMMGLDVTRKALATPAMIARVRSLGNPQAILFAEMMEFFAKSQKEVFGWESPPLHDPTCMAWLIDPECFTTRLMRVEVELRGALTYGRTSCDVFGLEQQAGPGRELYEGGGPLARPSGPNAHVAVDVDFDRFWSVVYDSFAFYG
ncbi:MAG: nucleoside hydrolase [Synergistota bacterium]|jgi:ribosylpyrimidine nucleosidase|nr:nucleoside hydrolase [Synergistota bacterium]OPZ37751.1 MAG: Pyrimidine-specific ribonucleoside hydrolase RihB [Synergistetes bacterium ADurb.BinA166]